MGADKVWLPLGPMPVLAYSLLAFAPHAARVVLVVGTDRLKDARTLLLEIGLVATVCEGGERRQDSVLNGLRAAGDAALVAIHDGARPLVSERLIEECFAAAARDGAAIAALPLRDTVKRATATGTVQGTVDREGLWAAQTPQVFRMELIREAYEELADDVTDDAAAVERLGHPVRLVAGDPYNLKLTTRDDLAVARALIRRPGFGREG